VPVRNVLKAKGESMIYLYDFGDSWRHEVMVEAILPTTASATKPTCIVGERRCPSEDVGGPHGYQECFGSHL
jgi:hypothetical protein